MKKNILVIYNAFVLATLSLCLQQGCRNMNDNNAKTTPKSQDSSKNGYEIDGKEILLRARDAYARLRSYTGTISLEYTSAYPTGSNHESRKANISFEKSDKFIFDSIDSNGNSYTIAFDGQNTTLTSNSKTEKRSTLQSTLLEYSGISLRASIMLPGILLGIQWHHDDLFLPTGDLLSAFSTNATLDGSDIIDGHKCYRVVCSRDVATSTFFVDAEDFLIRRMDEDASNAQLLVQKQAGGGGFTGRIVSTHTSQLWNWTERQPAQH